jgi:hypothetical protein
MEINHPDHPDTGGACFKSWLESSGIYCKFHYPLQPNAWILSWNRPWPFSPKSIQVHWRQLSSYVIWWLLQIVLYNLITDPSNELLDQLCVFYNTANDLLCQFESNIEEARKNIEVLLHILVSVFNATLFKITP